MRVNIELSSDQIKTLRTIYRQAGQLTAQFAPSTYRAKEAQKQLDLCWYILTGTEKGGRYPVHGAVLNKENDDA